MAISTCIDFLKVALTNVAVLMVSVKLATPGLLKVTVFWKKVVVSLVANAYCTDPIMFY